jgi:hypothetical protein
VREKVNVGICDRQQSPRRVDHAVSIRVPARQHRPPKLESA